MRTTVRLRRVWAVLGDGVATLTLVFAAVMCSNATGENANSRQWQERLTDIRWVAYTPPSGNPNRRIEATPDAIQEDLGVLRKAEFTGLVTYSCSGVMGKEFLQIAEEARFKGIIIGIWNPSNQRETAAATATASNPIVLGYCVGNEGLPEKSQTKGRYTLDQLTAAIQSLRTFTGKPVTTSEQYGDYSDERLLKLGDWVFPTVHPYFYRMREPLKAVNWTKAAYDDLRSRSGRFVLFKEVGLPTAGDEEGKMSEAGQKEYYTKLAKTDVRFVYFEGFDQPWKTHLPIEPHWGLFRSDRTPKRFVESLLSMRWYFYVYKDIDSPENHFKPTGYMGDCGDIHIKEGFKKNPHSGESCIRVVYTAKGKGPYTCDYGPPCKWAGVYWQEPPNNWGKDPNVEGKGFDLSRHSKLTFWARADKEGQVEFKVGGINERYGDSLKYSRSKTARLDTRWKAYEIDLREADLTHIIGGFCWATNWDSNPDGITFYLDDIRFEKE